MLNPDAVHSIVDKHEQLRPFSCFQSAVEMVLKLHGVLAEGEYPEQSILANDRCGYVPYAGKMKKYGDYHVVFEERKFPQISHAAIDEGRRLLSEGIYPIFSFRWPEGREEDYHGFVGFLNEGGDISLSRRRMLAPARDEAECA